MGNLALFAPLVEGSDFFLSVLGFRVWRLAASIGFCLIGHNLPFLWPECHDLILRGRQPSKFYHVTVLTKLKLPDGHEEAYHGHAE